MDNSRVKILVVDDEAPIRQVLSASLADESYQVDVAESAEVGLKKITEFQPDIVLLDIWMPGDMDGMGLLRALSEKSQRPDVIMMSGHGTIETAVEATKLGAWDFLEKPVSMDRVIIQISNLLEVQKVRREKRSLLSRLRQNIAIIGNSDQAKKNKELIARVAPTNSWVLIKGEPGVGKALVAVNIHYLSPRAGQAFIDFKCAHTTGDLIEGELFGYQKGAVIGSSEERKGAFDFADKGTLFLDDVDALPLPVQAKLVKYLEDHQIQRVGSSESVDLDVRVLAATTKDLPELVTQGLFREDLLYRINTIHNGIKRINSLYYGFSRVFCLGNTLLHKANRFFNSIAH